MSPPPSPPVCVQVAVNLCATSCRRFCRRAPRSSSRHWCRSSRTKYVGDWGGLGFDAWRVAARRSCGSRHTFATPAACLRPTGASAAALQVHHLSVLGIPAACIGGGMPWEQQCSIYDQLNNDPNSCKASAALHRAVAVLRSTTPRSAQSVHFAHAYHTHTHTCPAGSLPHSREAAGLWQAAEHARLAARTRHAGPRRHRRGALRQPVGARWAPRCPVASRRRAACVPCIALRCLAACLYPAKGCVPIKTQHTLICYLPFRTPSPLPPQTSARTTPSSASSSRGKNARRGAAAAAAAVTAAAALGCLQRGPAALAPQQRSIAAGPPAPTPNPGVPTCSRVPSTSTQVPVCAAAGADCDGHATRAARRGAAAGHPQLPHVQVLVQPTQPEVGRLGAQSAQPGRRQPLYCWSQSCTRRFELLLTALLLTAESPPHTCTITHTHTHPAGLRYARRRRLRRASRRSAASSWTSTPTKWAATSARGGCRSARASRPAGLIAWFVLQALRDKQVHLAKEKGRQARGSLPSIKLSISLRGLPSGYRMRRCLMLH